MERISLLLHLFTVTSNVHVLVGLSFVDTFKMSWVRAPSKAHVVSLSKKLYPYCLVLVGSRNGFEREFTIKLK